MKDLLFTYIIFGVFYSYSQNGITETPPQPPEASQLIQLVEFNNFGKKKPINFNTINFSEYPNTTELDLKRIANNDLLRYSANEWIEVTEEFEPKYFTVENQTFFLSGTSKVTPIEYVDLQIGSTRITNTTKLKLVEEYYLISESDTIVTYLNTYYSFFKGTQFIVEAFNKTRIFDGDLMQVFDGISYHLIETNRPETIKLAVIPNPTSNDSEVKFDLWSEGLVEIRLANQEGTINQTLHSEVYTSGEHSKQISLQNFQNGIYTISVLFQDQLYSSILIKL